MKVILFLLASFYVIYSQCLTPFPGSFSIIDSYFDEQFVSDFNQTTVSYKLIYPGFKNIESSTKAGNIGGWIGNISTGSDKQVSFINGKDEERQMNYKGRSVFWFLTLTTKKMWFAGASLMISGLYKFDKNESSSTAFSLVL